MIDTKYAVVIVTYNREKLLRECVDNVGRQTAAPDSIIIVNNASTDNTSNYLEKLNNKDGRFDIMNLPHNIGGAGGFAKGIERSLEKDVDCILIIDDDAMIAIDYMEKILQARQHNTQYKAFAGTLKTDRKIDTFHRRNLQRTGLMSKNCKEQEYRQPCFACDIWLEATQAEAAGILAAVRKLTEQGESVRVADSLPLGLRARRHLRYTDKEGLQEC